LVIDWLPASVGFRVFFGIYLGVVCFLFSVATQQRQIGSGWLDFWSSRIIVPARSVNRVGPRAAMIAQRSMFRHHRLNHASFLNSAASRGRYENQKGGKSHENPKANTQELEPC
jgi:hypothetical protein